MRATARTMSPMLEAWRSSSRIMPTEFACRVAAAATLATLHALDLWIITRFRDAQLLPDSARPASVVTEPVTDASNEASVLPRVESVRSTAGRDTLLALYFGLRDAIAPSAASSARTAAMRRPVTVRLSGPSGAITALSARVLARRAFRTALVPHAASGDATMWRYGWAYVAVVERGSAPVPLTGYRGWLLVPPADTSAR